MKDLLFFSTNLNENASKTGQFMRWFLIVVLVASSMFINEHSLTSGMLYFAAFALTVILLTWYTTKVSAKGYIPDDRAAFENGKKVMIAYIGIVSVAFMLSVGLVNGIVLGLVTALIYVYVNSRTYQDKNPVMNSRPNNPHSILNKKARPTKIHTKRKN